MPTINELKTAVRIARTADNAARTAVDRQQNLTGEAQGEALAAASALAVAESNPDADAAQLVALLTAKQDADALVQILNDDLATAQARWAASSAALQAAQQALADATG